MLADTRVERSNEVIFKIHLSLSLGAKVRETTDRPGDEPALDDAAAKTGTSPVRILIVEDEVLVRMFAVDALEDGGYLVEQADSAAQALASLNRLKDEIRAVIVDLGLPDRPGDQLAADMRAIRADLPILIASGRSEKELRERFAMDDHVGIIVKPFTGPMLLAALETLGIRGTIE